MSYSSREPLQGWNRLRNGYFEDSGLSVHTIPSRAKCVGGSIRYSIGESNDARVLIPLSMHESLPTFDEHGTLRISDVTYLDNGKTARFLSVSCLVNELESVFSEFTEELLERILNGHSSIDALTSSIQDFRALLAGIPEKEIEDSEIIGLAGELLVLSKILTINSAATGTWRGPLEGPGERHDFRHGTTALEVKTSTRTSNQTVKISSIDQLDPPSGGKLYLSHVVLEISSGGSISIGSLMEECNDLTSDPQILMQTAAAAGCSDPSAESWNRIGFNLEKVTIYSVQDDFPRIVSCSFKGGSLPTGVQSIEYLLDLGAAQDNKIEEDAYKNVYAEIAQ